MAKKKGRILYRDPKTGKIISKKKAMELGLIKKTSAKAKAKKPDMVWNGSRWVSGK